MRLLHTMLRVGDLDRSVRVSTLAPLIGRRPGRE